jgi:hypothetical protein
VLVVGSGQFPVAVPAGDGNTLVAFRGRGSHVSLAGRIDFATLDSAWNLTSRMSPATLDSPLDDRNPALYVVSPLVWLLLYAELNPGGPSGAYDTDSATFRIRFSRTLDGGITWSTPVTPPLRGLDTLLASPYGKMRRLSDGTVLASIYAGEGRVSNWPGWRPVLLASHDNGLKWSVLSQLPSSHSETAFLPVGGDTLVAAMRTGGTQIDLTLSPDLGGHWTEPFPITSFNQVPGDLALLPNGEILLVYGSRADGGKGIYYRRLRRAGSALEVSGPALVIPIVLAAADFGYPSIAAILPDERVAVVYYVSGPEVTGTTQMHLVTFCPAAPPS